MAEQKALALIDGKISEIPLGDTIRGVSGDSSYQKYFVGPLENYTIPQGVSSVVTGPLEVEGVLILDGRLEVL